MTEGDGDQNLSDGLQSDDRLDLTLDGGSILPGPNSRLEVTESNNDETTDPEIIPMPDFENEESQGPSSSDTKPSETSPTQSQPDDNATESQQSGETPLPTSTQSPTDLSSENTSSLKVTTDDQDNSMLQSLRDDIERNDQHLKESQSTNELIMMIVITLLVIIIIAFIVTVICVLRVRKMQKNEPKP